MDIGMLGLGIGIGKDNRVIEADIAQRVALQHPLPDVHDAGHS